MRGVLLKRELMIIWRIVYLIALLLLLVTKTISVDTFLAIIIGIVIFYGIPEVAKMIKGDNGGSHK